MPSPFTAHAAMRSTEALDYQRVPRPVAAMPKPFDDGSITPPHSHERHQVLFSTTGLMSIATTDGTWVVPTHRALWMPAGTRHQVTMHGPVHMHTLYLRPDAAQDLPQQCTVLSVTPLLRELIVRATELPLLYDEVGPDGRLIQVLLDELRRMPALPLQLPRPHDPRLARLCDQLLAEPADLRTLEAWAAPLGLSSRSVARLFRAQTGMSFGQWRQQARLLQALRLLAQGRSVTDTALEVGYDSASAFGSMFRRSLGMSPIEYLAQDPALRTTGRSRRRPR